MRPVVQFLCTRGQKLSRLIFKVPIVDKIPGYCFAKLNSPFTFVAPSAGGVLFESLEESGGFEKYFFRNYLRG